MTNEEWRPVVGYEGLYEVSSAGRVRGLPRWSLQGRWLPLRELTLHKHPKGYRAVGLQKEGRNKRLLVHRLVCEAFHGPQPDGKPDVCHIDEVKTNNRSGNLKWGSRSENIQQYADSGRYRNGTSEWTQCARGHEYTEENTYTWANPRTNHSHRICRTCRREYMAERRAS